nr:cytochrome c family protein [Janthinobacterium agaricidamnosum]
MKLSALLVLAMAGQPAAQAAPDLEAGKRAFATCASCHQVGRSARAGFGPHLHGVFGRKAGTTADFHYSPAMKNASIVWTEQTLAAFLKSPGDVVPGNKMRFWGMTSDEKIANLLAYLRSVQ